ncbi:MAG: hypothetical protein ACQEW2_08715 [Bacillota bacterium]
MGQRDRFIVPIGTMNLSPCPILRTEMDSAESSDGGGSGMMDPN